MRTAVTKVVAKVVKFEAPINMLRMWAWLAEGVKFGADAFSIISDRSIPLENVNTMSPSSLKPL